MEDPNNSRYCNYYRNYKIDTSSLLNSDNAYAKDFNAVISASDCGGAYNGIYPYEITEDRIFIESNPFGYPDKFRNKPGQPVQNTDQNTLKQLNTPMFQYVSDNTASNPLQTVPNTIIKLAPEPIWYINTYSKDNYNYMKYCVDNTGKYCAPASVGSPSCLTCSGGGDCNNVKSKYSISGDSEMQNCYLPAVGPPELTRSASFVPEGCVLAPSSSPATPCPPTTKDVQPDGKNIPKEGPWLGKPYQGDAACQTMCPCCKRKACSRDTQVFNGARPGRTRSGILNKRPHNDKNAQPYVQINHKKWQEDTSMGANCDDCDENFTFGIGWLNPWLIYQFWDDDYTISFRRVYPKDVLENFSKSMYTWMDKFCTSARFPSCKKNTGYGSVSSYDVCGPWFPLYTKEQYETWNDIARRLYLKWLLQPNIASCWDAECLLSLNVGAALRAMQYRFDNQPVQDMGAETTVDCPLTGGIVGSPNCARGPMDCKKILRKYNSSLNDAQKYVGSKYIDDYVEFCNYFDDNGVIKQEEAVPYIIRKTCASNCQKIPPGFPNMDYWVAKNRTVSVGNIDMHMGEKWAEARELNMENNAQPDVCGKNPGPEGNNDAGGTFLPKEWQCCAGKCGCGAKALIPGTKDNIDAQPYLFPRTPDGKSTNDGKNPKNWFDVWAVEKQNVVGSHGIANIQCKECGQISLHGGKNDKAGRLRFAKAFEAAMSNDKAENSETWDGDDYACFIEGNNQKGNSDRCGSAGEYKANSEECEQVLYPCYTKDRVVEPKQKCGPVTLDSGKEDSKGYIKQKYFAGGYPGGINNMLLVVWGDLWVKDLIRWRPDCYVSCVSDDEDKELDERTGHAKIGWPGWGHVDYGVPSGIATLPNGEYGWFKREGNGSAYERDEVEHSERWYDCGGAGKTSRFCQRNKGIYQRYGISLYDRVIDSAAMIAPMMGLMTFNPYAAVGGAIAGGLTALIGPAFRPDTASQIVQSIYTIMGVTAQFSPSGNEYDQIFRPRFYGCPPQSNEARWGYNGCCSGSIFQFPTYNSNFGLCTEQFGGINTYKTEYEKNEKKKKSGWFNEWVEGSDGAWKLTEINPYTDMYSKNIYFNENIYIQTTVGPSWQWPSRDGGFKIIPSTRHNCDKVPLWVDCSTDYCLYANEGEESENESLLPEKGGKSGGQRRSCQKNCDFYADESAQTHGPGNIFERGNDTNLNGYDTRFLSTIDAFNTYLGEGGGMCRWNSANDAAITSQGRVGYETLPGLRTGEELDEQGSLCREKLPKEVIIDENRITGIMCGDHACYCGEKIPGGGRFACDGGGGGECDQCKYMLEQPQDNNHTCTPLHPEYRACPKKGVNNVRDGQGIWQYGGCWKDLCQGCPDWFEIGDESFDKDGAGATGQSWWKDHTTEPPRKPPIVGAPAASPHSGNLKNALEQEIEKDLQIKYENLVCDPEDRKRPSSVEELSKCGTKYTKSPRLFNTCQQGVCGLGGQSDDTQSKFYYKQGIDFCEDAGRVAIPNFTGTPLEGLTPIDLRSSCVYGMPASTDSEKLTPRVKLNQEGQPVLDKDHPGEDKEQSGDDKNIAAHIMEFDAKPTGWDVKTGGKMSMGATSIVKPFGV
tara:strand:- start:3934 stop:8727 length:4794 start_codon:yes stop_codon:yes gene_type:complete